MSGTTFRCMLSSGSQAFPAGLPAGYVASAKRRDWSLVATNCARLANRSQAGHGAKLRQVWHASRRISAYSTVGGATEDCRGALFGIAGGADADLSALVALPAADLELEAVAGEHLNRESVLLGKG